MSRALLLTWLCAGCAAAGSGPDFPTSSSFPETPRRSPSFAAEPSLTLPEVPAASATTVGDVQRGVTPLDPDAARDLVSKFFIAVLLESSGDLFPLFATQAWVVSEGGRQPAQALWRSRLAQLDYTSLTGRIVGAPQTLRTYTFQSAARARQDGVLVPSAPDEVVVVVTPMRSWAGKTRLFGDQLSFRLRPKQQDPAYEIAEIAEDFRLP